MNGLMNFLKVNISVKPENRSISRMFPEPPKPPHPCLSSFQTPLSLNLKCGPTLEFAQTMPGHESRAVESMDFGMRTEPSP